MKKTSKSKTKKPVIRKPLPTIEKVFAEKDSHNWYTFTYILSDGTNFSKDKYITWKELNEYKNEVIGQIVGYTAEFSDGGDSEHYDDFVVRREIGSEQHRDDAIENARTSKIKEYEKLLARVKKCSKLNEVF